MTDYLFVLTRKFETDRLRLHSWRRQKVQLGQVLSPGSMSWAQHNGLHFVVFSLTLPTSSASSHFKVYPKCHMSQHVARTTLISAQQPLNGLQAPTGLPAVGPTPQEPQCFVQHKPENGTLLLKVFLYIAIKLLLRLLGPYITGSLPPSLTCATNSPSLIMSQPHRSSWGILKCTSLSPKQHLCTG